MLRSSRRDLLWTALLPVLARGAAGGDSIEAAIEKIRPLFLTKKPTQPGDWLADHKEPGQTYAQYRAATAQRAIDRYQAIRIVPIGPFSDGQVSVLEVTQDFLRPFLGLPFEFCPECQPKLWWTLGLDLLARSRKLEEVASKHGLDRLAAAYAKQTAALGA